MNRDHYDLALCLATAAALLIMHLKGLLPS